MAPIFSLLNLPAEFQCLVISLVQDSATLLNLCQCSHLMHDLVLPYLYRYIEIKHETENGEHSRYQIHSSPSDDGLYCWFFQYVYDFIVLILRKPERAHFVKSFKLSKEACAHFYLPRKSVHNHIKNYIKQTRWTTKEGSRWLNGIRKSLGMEDLMAVLLPSLPQLEKLEFTCAPGADYIYHFDVMLASIGYPNTKLPETAFRRLQHLTVPGFNRARNTNGSQYIPGGIWPHQLARFLQIPSMRIVEARLRMCDEDETSCPANDLVPVLEPASSPITSLVLESFGFDPIGIKAMVLACQNLKRLDLNIIETYSTEEEVTSLVAATMLAPQSLEILSLRYYDDEEPHEWDIFDGSERCLISLVNFPNLRDVTLGVFFLFGMRLLRNSTFEEGFLGEKDGKTVLRCLPQQIESLRIVLCNGEEAVPIFANVEAILWRKREGQLQRLASIVLEHSVPNLDTIRRGHTLLGRYENAKAPPLLNLKSLANGVGVDLDVICKDEYPQLRTY